MVTTCRVRSSAELSSSILHSWNATTALTVDWTGQEAQIQDGERHATTTKLQPTTDGVDSLPK